MLAGEGGVSAMQCAVLTGAATAAGAVWAHYYLQNVLFIISPFRIFANSNYFTLKSPDSSVMILQVICFSPITHVSRRL